MLLTLVFVFIGTCTSAYADCNVVPASFLPYGGLAGDKSQPMSVNPNTFTFDFVSAPYTVFGMAGTGIRMRPTPTGSYLFTPISLAGGPTGILINPRQYPSTLVYDQRVGTMYARGVTSGSDLDTVNQVLCSEYDGAIIITGICGADNVANLAISYQIWFAYKADETRVLIIFDEPQDNVAPRLIQNYDTNYQYPLDEVDISNNNGMTAVDVTGYITVSNGESLPVASLICPSTSCIGADLSSCGPIGRPDPRCDDMTCAWGSVEHTYSCPASHVCNMDCYGCSDATPMCGDKLAEYASCNETPTYTSTCSKTMGVGIIMYEYTCVNQANVEETVTCHEWCCCEKPQDPVVMTTVTAGPPTPPRPYCTRADVVSWGFLPGVLDNDKRAYCPGYNI